MLSHVWIGCGEKHVYSMSTSPGQRFYRKDLDPRSTTRTIILYEYGIVILLILVLSIHSCRNDSNHIYTPEYNRMQAPTYLLHK